MSYPLGSQLKTQLYQDPSFLKAHLHLMFVFIHSIQFLFLDYLPYCVTLP